MAQSSDQKIQNHATRCKSSGKGCAKCFFFFMYSDTEYRTSVTCLVVDVVRRLPSSVPSLNTIYFGGAPKEKAGGCEGADPPKENAGCEDAALVPKEKEAGLPCDEVEVDEGAAPDPKLNFGASPPLAAPKPNAMLPPAGALDPAACVVDSDLGVDPEAPPKPNVKPLPLAAAPPDAGVPPKPN